MCQIIYRLTVVLTLNRIKICILVGRTTCFVYDVKIRIKYVFVLVPCSLSRLFSLKSDLGYGTIIPHQQKYHVL